MVKIKIYPTKEQKKILNEWFNVSRYTYNKAVAKAKETKSYNFQSLRNLIVTHKHKDGTMNQLKDFELNVPKDIRAGSIKILESNFKSARTNYLRGNVKKFDIGFKKKKDKNQFMRITKAMISNQKIEDGVINVAKVFTKNKLKLKIGKRNKKKYSNFEVNADTLLTKVKGSYYFNLPVEYKDAKVSKVKTCCGIDPGVRTFLTCFNNENTTEYHIDKDKVKKINDKLDLLKSLKKQKRKFEKYESKKLNIINEMHWQTVRHLLKENDLVFFGDIKSHNIVKNKSNHTLNRNINDLKFFQFKEKLIYKAKALGKIVIFVNEAYTTKTCCKCGIFNDPKCSEIYTCSNCKVKRGRDVNASKNILMKGMMIN